MIFMFEDVTDPHQTNTKTSLLHPLSHYSFNTTHDYWYHDDIIWQILALGKTCFAVSPRFFAPRRNAPGKVPSLHGSHATGCGDPTVHPSAVAAPSGCRSADSMSGSPAKREISRNGSKGSKVLFEKKAFTPQDTNRRFHRKFNKNMNAKTGGFIRGEFSISDHLRPGEKQANAPGPLV